MKTPDRLSHQGAVHLSARISCLALCAGILWLLPLSASAGVLDLGFADYQNTWYDPAPAPIPGVSDYAASNTAVYQGHVGPYAAPGSGDTPTTPTDGSYLLWQSAIGEPVGGRAFYGADFKLGEEITPPAGEVAVPLNHVPVFDLPRHAFYVPTARKVFAGDYGPVSVTWSTVQHTSVTIEYVISPEPVQPPVRLYHTEADKGGLVDLAGAPATTIHYNESAITSVASMWIDAAKKLHARNETGLVVLHFDSGTSFSGLELVDVRPYIADDTASPTWVGTILTPRQTPANQVPVPTVSRGDTGPKPYVYQYDGTKGPAVAGQVFAVRPTPSAGQISLFWRQQGRFPGVEWPYELRAYVAAWDPAVDWQRIYYTADGVLGPPVRVGGIDIVQFFYNEEIASTPTLFLYSNPREIRATDAGGRNESGRILMRLDNLSAEASVLEFVQVLPYSPDLPIVLVDVGQRLLPRRVVANALQDQTLINRGFNGNPMDDTNYAYQHLMAGAFRGAVFAVRPIPSGQSHLLEVFFRRKGQMDLVWPYEMMRFTADWPANAQLYVRSSSSQVLGPEVVIPEKLNAQLMPYQERIVGGTRAQFNHATLGGYRFASDLSGVPNGDYYALLQYQTGPQTAPGSDWVGFQAVRCLRHLDTRLFDRSLHAWSIGTEITDSYHRGAAPGYIYHVPGVDTEDKYDPRVYNEGGTGYQTGQVLPVFPGNLEVWWCNVTTHGLTTANYALQWPSKVMRYSCNWPSAYETLVIASQTGSGIIPAPQRSPELYFQNDKTKVGYNPNYEHAAIFPLESGIAAFALRCDLNSFPSCDKPIPFVLLKYRDSADRNLWRYRVFNVVAEDATHKFDYPATAGQVIPRPYPLAVLLECGETTPGLHNGNYGVAGAYWQDRNKTFWARAASDDGGTSRIAMRYWYPVQGGWVYPDPNDNSRYPTGARAPWLDGLPQSQGAPVTVNYTVAWPSNLPVLKKGESLVMRKYGLPDILGQASVERIYESLDHTTRALTLPGRRNILLIDPLRERSVPLDQLPMGADAIDTVNEGGKLYFAELPPHLRSRVYFDPTADKLALIGEFYDMLGEDILLLNVLTARDKAYLLALTTNVAFRDAVAGLYEATSGPIVLSLADSNSAGKAVVGVSGARGGYVTLAMQNHVSARPLPVSLEIFRVVDDLYTGEIKVIQPDCCFDEKLTLRHSGDFAGKADTYRFEWQYHPDMDGTQPPPDSPMWFSFPTDPASGVGSLDVTIAGPGIFTLSDNWFRVHYCLSSDPDTSRSFSDWTAPQLAPGWIKRVIGQINPFTQRASGGGIQGAEQRFSQYQTQTVNTMVSMISQAGPRWVGNVPMNCGPGLDSLGLIEVYDTVLGRGKKLSVDAGYSYPPANNALLLAAGRIADLYLLLGNEAYADAADPTIAFGTNDGEYGAEASSIHCFMNQTSSLLEEELALLRGRDDSAAPGVRIHPLYNRLMWNFTRDITGGEVAYALNYNIQDAQGNADGTINELDAMHLYPQGHGDAWGHYLTAIKRYYDLLKHPNFDWVPRAEAVLVGGQPVTVDYLDERKFAKVASAKAHAGSEIVSLTYRQAFVEDPNGQWQGYKDPNPDRAWGLSEWASRVGQGTYFDWVAANAILPSSDTVHTGIQKVDRQTVLELREITASFDNLQQTLDQADVGLNPLGLAKNVVPFDIDPAFLEIGSGIQGLTHFEQIYERALAALNNAVSVFNHATNCTQLLRRQADTQTEFQADVQNSEADFNSRLIEAFGYPYSGDIGAGKTYPQGYDGPDLYHFDYVDPSQLLGRDRSSFGMMQQFTVALNDYGSVDFFGNVGKTTTNVTYHMFTDGFGMVVPDDTWGQRRAPGEIQKARSQLIQLLGQFAKARLEYSSLVQQINDKAEDIDLRQLAMTAKLGLLSTQFALITAFNITKVVLKGTELGMKRAYDALEDVSDATVHAMPKVIIAGLASGGDLSSIGRATVKTAAAMARQAAATGSDAAELGGLKMDILKEETQMLNSLILLGIDEASAVHGLVRELENLVRQEATQRLELNTMIETMVQAAGDYSAAVAKGFRLLEDRTRFRQQTAARVQSFRYKDMGFRIFRNDALQKYRAQFDLAARYVYLAAKAYDYETNLLSQDRQAGEFFMTSIARARSIGNVLDGVPQTGGGLGDPGLSDIMARMKLNWDLSLKGQLGFNNPQIETNRFSLRYGLFRSVTDDTWREVLQRHRVDNILAVPEFKRYCRMFQPHFSSEPGLVIPVPTTINFGFNFFGRELAAGDSAYDSTNFATKIRSVGVWFTGYDALTSQGLSHTPRVYLIPVGYDVMRSPTGDSGETRIWKILDQKLPVPFPIGPSDLNDPSWIPIVDTLSEEYAAIRQFSSFRAYHDPGELDPEEMTTDSRLIGRSVWNTRWLLIIPAGTLHANRQLALDQFVNGVTDIKLFFQTYAFSGN